MGNKIHSSYATCSISVFGSSPKMSILILQWNQQPHTSTFLIESWSNNSWSARQGTSGALWIINNVLYGLSDALTLTLCFKAKIWALSHQTYGHYVNKMNHFFPVLLVCLYMIWERIPASREWTLRKRKDILGWSMVMVNRR